MEDEVEPMQTNKVLELVDVSHGKECSKLRDILKTMLTAKFQQPEI